MVLSDFQFRIFGISHPNTERYLHLSRHLSQTTRFPWEIVGVDGRELVQHDNFAAMGHNQVLSPGQIGCSLAHCAAYARMRDLNLSGAVVIEDDVQLPKNFDEIVSEVVNKTRPGEVISLHNPMMERNPFSSRNVEKVLEMNLIYPMSPRSIRSTSAYAISIEAALKILATNNPVHHVADHWDAFYEKGLVRTYRILHPSPCRWLPFESSIGYGGHITLRNFLKRNRLIKTFVEMRRSYIFGKRLNNVRLVDMVSPIATE